MKKILAFLFLFPSLSYASQKIAVTVSDGSLQPGTTAGFNVSSGTVQSLYSSTFTVSTSFVSSSTGTSQGLFHAGIYVSSFSVTNTTVSTGSLSGTYYYNVYPIGPLGQIGDGYKQTNYSISGGGASVTWNPALGATGYRLARSTTRDAWDGYYQLSSGATSYLDTGNSFTASGNPFPGTSKAAGNSALLLHGILNLNASNGSIVWNNFETGNPDSYIGETSAGEFVIHAGSQGTAPGTFILSDGNDVSMVKINRENLSSSSARIQFGAYKTGGGTGDMQIVTASSVTIAPAGTDTFAFRSSEAQNLQDYRMESGKKIYWNISGGVSTGSATGFTVSNSSQPQICENNNCYNFTQGQFSPFSDGGQNLGSGSAHWNTVFATNGTINTSMSKYKKDIKDLPLKDSVPRGISYRWKEPKGRDRTYIGFLADDLPKDAFYQNDDGTIDDRAVYQNAVIGILCAHVRELEKQVADLKRRVR